MAQCDGAHIQMQKVVMEMAADFSMLIEEKELTIERSTSELHGKDRELETMRGEVQRLLLAQTAAALADADPWEQPDR